MNKGKEMEKLKTKIDSLAEELLLAYEELNLFYDISSSMRSPLDSEKTIDFILSKALEVIEADKATILVLDESENKLKIRKGLVSGHWISVDPSHEIDIEGTMLSKVIHGERGLIVNDITECQNGISPLIATKSLLSVSLYAQNKVIGVFTLGDRRGREFTSKDLKLSTVLSSQTALVIENDRLFQENATMAEIGRIIGSTLNIDEVYERFAEEVRKLVPFDRMNISLVNYEENNSTVAYSTGNAVSVGQPGDVFPLAGSATEEVMKTRTGILFHPESRGEVAGRFPGLLTAFEAGHHSMMTVPLISKDKVIGAMYFGSTRPRAYTDRDLRLAEGIGSQIAGAIANAQLFNEHKQAEKEKRSLEEQLRQSQKMEAIGQLAGGVAHDFNNLLTVIKGYSQLSLIDLKTDNPLKGNIEEIEKASERAVDLTRQLLAFSRRQVMELKVIDLSTILQNLEKMLRRVIGEDIELIIKLHGDLGKVKVDPGQIEQVILNLAVNAKDAMPNGGNLTIEITNEELDEEYACKHVAIKSGPYVRLSVSDTGCGMTPEVRERVFEPFFTTKEKGKGTGLGLSTVYGIVKQSGGNIWVYSEPGHGTTFKINLPRVDEPVDVLGQGVTGEELPWGNETILVVEDEEGVRKLAVRILQRQGYKVLEASDGGEASILCDQHGGTIHLLLTDVVLPAMSGRKFAENLLSMRPEMRVLYMSGYTDNAIAAHGVLEEGLNYIQKPFTVGRLLRKVREVLDKNSDPII
ncbi:MAG: hypothetical protein A2157_16500 [Deltaproteobacteria bacterium RBG_16_47_11]|nr:MAG: hypothetical protein A2157_16500 [Deltaproteobacteria bacterium RBG_16_47_11]